MQLIFGGSKVFRRRRDRCEGIGGGIDDDPCGLRARLMDALHQFAFEIRLAEIDLEAEAASFDDAHLPDIGKGRRTVDAGLRSPSRLRFGPLRTKMVLVMARISNKQIHAQGWVDGIAMPVSDLDPMSAPLSQP